MIIRTSIFLLILNICPAVATAQVFYDYSDIAPLLNSCNTCHGRGEQGFKSNTYQGLITSVSPPENYDGPYIVPFEAGNSPLIDKIEADPEVGLRMPLREEPLSAEEINIIREWIDNGAVESLATSTEEGEDVPGDFNLEGNYPNPFNPTTNVVFESAFPAEFTMDVYNVAGARILSTSGNSVTGRNSVSIDLLNQPSGVYFYRIRFISSGNPGSILDGKMTLLR